MAARATYCECQHDGLLPKQGYARSVTAPPDVNVGRILVLAHFHALVRCVGRETDVASARIG